MENLVTQFNGQLAHFLQSDHYFEIDVRTSDKGKSFYICLAKDKLNVYPDADIGLHVMVELNTNIVSANTRSKKRRDDDLVSKGKTSNQLKENIKINIQICDDSFYIAINGKRRIKIYHRLDATTLGAIQIGGDIKQVTRLDHRKTYPSIWPPTMDTRHLAFSNDIPIRFKIGHLMIIKGQCYGSSSGAFFFQMMHAYSEAELFIFNARFNEQVVVRNTRIDRQYGNEERHGGFPFLFDRPFCVGIACHETEFRIAVNGSMLCTFAYRHPSTYPLSSFGGIRVFSEAGVEINITQVDHKQLNRAEYDDFVRYTN